MTRPLRLATWNIHKGIGPDRRYDLARTMAVLQALDADVVCLQEVDENVSRSRHHSQTRIIARELRYEHHAVGLNVSVGSGHYGNATLSRHPIVHARNFDLTIPPKKRRSGLVTRVLDGNGEPLTVVNVHLGLLHLERRIQVRSLLAHLFANAAPAEGLVIAGDWNDWGNRLHASLAAPHGFHLARLPDHRRAGLKTYPSRRPLAALDKILYREPVRLHHVACVLEDRAREASDHLPLVAELHLTRAAHAPAGRDRLATA